MHRTSRLNSPKPLTAILRAIIVTGATAVIVPNLSCGGAAPTTGPETPTIEVGCKLGGQVAPLTVEWPSTRRAQLEDQIAAGLMIVKATECEITLLSQCSLERPYGYRAVTPKTEQVTINNENELYANLPVGAASLRGKLAQRGQLTVDMTIVGRFSTPPGSLYEDMLKGSCQGATHAITGVSVGAFELATGAAVGAEGGVAVMGAGAGAKHQQSRETLSRDGDASICHQAGAADEKPPRGCSAVLRIELTPLERKADFAAAKQAILQAQRETALCGRMQPPRPAVVGAGARVKVHPDGTFQLIYPLPAEGVPPFKDCIRRAFESKTIPPFAGEPICLLVSYDLPECMWPDHSPEIPACATWEPANFSVDSSIQPCESWENNP
jgi:hypothetical protein